MLLLLKALCNFFLTSTFPFRYTITTVWRAVRSLRYEFHQFGRRIQNWLNCSCRVWEPLGMGSISSLRLYKHQCHWLFYPNPWSPLRGCFDETVKSLRQVCGQLQNLRTNCNCLMLWTIDWWTREEVRSNILAIWLPKISCVILQ